MKYTCNECGGIHVFEIGIPAEITKLTIMPLNKNTEFNSEQFPEIVGGYYCQDCQSFVSVGQAKASKKQKELIKKLAEQVGDSKWTDEKLEPLTMDHARKIIYGLSKKARENAPATKNQKAIIVKLCKEQKKFLDVSKMTFKEASDSIKALMGKEAE